jgi:hypothetical protein
MNALEEWARAGGWEDYEVLCFLMEYGKCSDNCMSLADVANAKECERYIGLRLWQFEEYVRTMNLEARV